MIGSGMPEIRSLHYQRSPGCDALKISAEEIPADRCADPAKLSGPLLYKERVRRERGGV